MLSGDIKKLEATKSSYHLLHQHGREIGELTYTKLFKKHPETQKLFADTSPGQAQRLIDTILLYCELSDDYERVYDKLDQVAHTHIDHHIKPEYYPWMKEAFTSAIHDVLGNKVSEELLQSWGFGFDSLSAELIHAENLIRKHIK